MIGADDIDALLPQTQCTRCGYTGCKPYAEAIAAGTAEINQCPPGGSPTIAALAHLLHRRVLPLNPATGVEGPPLVAQIDELACIGCTKCLPPCPVGAIIGARSTGCELCVTPCPVDCIKMIPREKLTDAPSAPAACPFRDRFQAHKLRVARRAGERAG